MENNSSIKFLMKLIQKICSENLSNQDCITSGIVDQVNADGTVNVHIPPDDVSFTNIPNQCPFGLRSGDTVKLIKEKGRASNMWVIAKCGTSYVDMAHPVGSFYWSSDPTDPGILFGGTWEQINDRFLLAVGKNHQVPNVSGGRFFNDLGVITNVSGSSNTFGVASNGSYAGRILATRNTEIYPTDYPWHGFEAIAAINKNDYLPPYYTAYCWKRIS